jgi:hypothetical protein
VIPQCSILLLDKSHDVRSLALSLMDACLLQMKEYHQILTEQMEKERMKGNADKIGGGGSESFSNKGGSNQSSSSASSSAAGILASPISESIMNLGWTSWLSSSASTAKASESLDTNNATALSSTNPMGSPLSSSTNLSSMEQPQQQSKDYSRNSSSASLAQSGKQQSFSSSSKPAAVPIASKGWDDDDIDDDLDLDDENNAGMDAGKKKSGDKDFFGDFEEEATTGSSKPPTFGINEKNRIDKSPKPVVSGKGPKSSTASKVAVKKLEFSKDEGWDDF